MVCGTDDPDIKTLVLAQRKRKRIFIMLFPFILLLLIVIVCSCLNYNGFFGRAGVVVMLSDGTLQSVGRYGNQYQVVTFLQTAIPILIAVLLIFNIFFLKLWKLRLLHKILYVLYTAIVIFFALILPHATLLIPK